MCLRTMKVCKHTKVKIQYYVIYAVSGVHIQANNIPLLLVLLTTEHACTLQVLQSVDQEHIESHSPSKQCNNEIS